MASSVAPYLALITPEHNQKPNFAAVMTALLQPLADQITITNSIPSLYNLDTAVGAQLDTVGQWIGITRYLNVALTNVFFSFDIAGLGFDQGAWAPAGGATVLTALPDQEYRLLLYAQVAINHWDGTVPGAEAAINSFWTNLGYAEYILDGQDMTVSYFLVGPPLDAVTTALYNGGLLDVRAAGVGVNAHYWIQGVNGVPLYPTFGFDLNNIFIAGFDVGHWLGSPVSPVVPLYIPPYGSGIIFNFTGSYVAPGGGGLVLNFHT